MAQIPNITPPEYVTRSATAAVEALLADADRLGLTWRLRPGTVGGSGLAAPESVPVVVDGDAVTARARSMVGAVVAGQRVWVVQIPPAGLYVLGFIGTAQVGTTVADNQIGDILDISSTSYIPGSPECSVTFTAPASESVVISVYARLRGDGTNNIFVTPEVREINVSGALVLSPADSNSVLTNSVNTRTGTSVYYLDDLTAGAVYFARTMHRVAGGTTADIFDRRLIVQPG